MTEPEVLKDTVGKIGSGFSTGVGGSVGSSPAPEESAVGFSLMARNSKVGRSMTARYVLVTGVTGQPDRLDWLGSGYASKEGESRLLLDRVKGERT